MRRFICILRAFLREEDGPTAIEYAIMVSLIAGVVVGAAQLLGANTNGLLENTAALFGGF